MSTTPDAPTQYIPKVGGREPRSRQRELARRRERQRRRRLVMVGALLVAAALGGIDAAHVLVGGNAPTARFAQPAGSGQPTASIAVPQSGPGTFAYAAGTGPVLGTGGALHRFRVAVENGTNQDPAAFATVAEQTLGDARSWIAGGDVKFQRVPQAGPYDFTLYLATPATSEKMCEQGGLHTDGFASCRLPGQVIIDLARWLTAIPGYGAPLPAYQQFALNHEVGRELGKSNEACPGPGQLAPVMQNQTLGLKGCKPNAWPYVAGSLYVGTVLPN